MLGLTPMHWIQIGIGITVLGAAITGRISWGGEPTGHRKPVRQVRWPLMFMIACFGIAAFVLTI